MHKYQQSITNVEKKKDDYNKLIKDNKEFEKKYNTLEKSYQLIKYLLT